jgi:hypothetical protein
MMVIYKTPNLASTKFENSQTFVQLKDLYQGSDAQKKLDEQISKYREKAKKNAQSFGYDKVDEEKKSFRIKIFRPNTTCFMSNSIYVPSVFM